jgi:hypothetical protein
VPGSDQAAADGLNIEDLRAMDDDRAGTGGSGSSQAGEPAEPELAIGDELERRRAAGGLVASAIGLPGGARAGKLLSSRRGPGRPKGARNIRTETVAVALIERYGDPLEADVAIGTMPLGELITEMRTIASDRGLKLEASVMDLARWQRDCRGQAMPYLHSRRATTDDKGVPVTPVIAFGRADRVTINAGSRSIEDVEANQGVIDVTPGAGAAKSHDGKSHDDASD